MGTGVSSHSGLVVAAFHHVLWVQFLVLLGVIAALAVLRSFLRARQFGLAEAAGEKRAATVPTPVEPIAHKVLRIGFGLLWLLDGILQGQAAMPLSLPSQVMQPAAGGSPTWVVHLINFASSLWIDHPVSAAAATVWIQVGIGVLLLVAPFGPWSRLAGALSAGWGLLVWAFGEAFGGIFAPGLTWLFGAPGAVLFYVVAGVLLTLPSRVWTTPTLGRWTLRAMGLFFVGMAVLQAWPGRGFWQGQSDPHVSAGTLTSMVQNMAQTQQPGLFESLVRAFGQFDAAHGWAVNLFAVIALGAIGVGLLVARPRITRWAVIGGCVLCLATWVLIEDLGFFGGVGTDPNSMIPMALVFVGGYLAMTRATAQPLTVPHRAPAWGLAAWQRLDPSYLLRAGGCVGALAVVLLGVVPMTAAATGTAADPILTESVNGVPVQEHVRAPNFDLIDQYGRRVTLSSFRGRTVALTFLDPVCTSDCPVIAQEFRIADSLLGAQRKDVAMVAVVANPIYRAVNFMVAFDRQEYLNHLANWYYLTAGTTAGLQRALATFGALDLVEPAGAMVDHSEFADVIDSQGYIRTILSTDPGAATGALQSSFASLLDSEIRQAMTGSSAS